jgi:hypothetical protein
MKCLSNRSNLKAFAKYNLGDTGTATTLITSAIATINDNSAKYYDSHQRVRRAAAFAINSIITCAETPEWSYSEIDVYPVERLIFAKNNI